MRILLTGGAGAIGVPLLRRLLTHGHSCAVLDRRPLPQDYADVTQFSSRVSSAVNWSTVLEGIEAIVHLEWSGGVHEAMADPLGTHARNVTASLGLLEACRERKLPIIFASSGVYPGNLSIPYEESMPLADHSLYGVQKAHVESLIRAYAHGFGIVGASLRLGNVYGPEGRPTQIIPRMRNAIEMGNLITLTGDGLQIRDFVHVDDIAAAIIAVLEKVSNLRGDVFNIGTGRGTSLLELAQLMMVTMGKSVEIKFSPAREEESRFLALNVDRAKEQLGWEAAIPLEAGLKSIVS